MSYYNGPSPATMSLFGTVPVATPTPSSFTQPQPSSFAQPQPQFQPQTQPQPSSFAQPQFQPQTQPQPSSFPQPQPTGFPQPQYSQSYGYNQGYGYNQAVATIGPQHPYNKGVLPDGTPVVKQGAVYIVANPERPYNAPGKVFWKIMGDGTRNVKDRLKAEITGVRWVANQKYWGLATSADDNDAEFARLVKFVYQVTSQPLPQLPAYGAPVQYGAPAAAPQYGAPAPAPQYGAPAAAPAQYGALAPAPQYGAPAPVPAATQNWFHGMVTAIDSNHSYVTYKVSQCPAIGDEVVLLDVSVTPNREAKLLVDSRTPSHYNEQFFDTFTAKSAAGDIKLIFKIVNGFWAPMVSQPQNVKLVAIHAQGSVNTTPLSNRAIPPVEVAPPVPAETPVMPASNQGDMLAK